MKLFSDFSRKLTHESQPIVKSHPYWWHHHGRKMDVQTSEKDAVVIESSAARLTITQNLHGSSWNVGWGTSHAEGVTGGRTMFTANELALAFGLSEDDTTEESRWLIKKYDADCAKQGKFIRRGYYLSIPGPGTGNDGDPNISIELDDKIQAAVQKLLS